MLHHFYFIGKFYSAVAGKAVEPFKISRMNLFLEIAKSLNKL